MEADVKNARLLNEIRLRSERFNDEGGGTLPNEN